VRVEPASVPSTYLVQDLRPQTVSVDPSNPGRVDFKVRAYRSVLGVVRVYDVCSGAYVPMAGATVTLNPLNLVTTTDRVGRYVFRDLPAGNHNVSATHAGKTTTVPLTLPSGGALLKDVNLSLTPSDTDRAGCSAGGRGPVSP
jgi:hypothetical protein